MRMYLKPDEIKTLIMRANRQFGENGQRIDADIKSAHTALRTLINHGFDPKSTYLNTGKGVLELMGIGGIFTAMSALFSSYKKPYILYNNAGMDQQLETLGLTSRAIKGGISANNKIGDSELLKSDLRNIISTVIAFNPRQSVSVKNLHFLNCNCYILSTQLDEKLEFAMHELSKRLNLKDCGHEIIDVPFNKGNAKLLRPTPTLRAPRHPK